MLDCEDVSKKDNSRGKSKNLHIQSLLPWWYLAIYHLISNAHLWKNC